MAKEMMVMKRAEQKRRYRLENGFLLNTRARSTRLKQMASKFYMLIYH